MHVLNVVNELIKKSDINISINNDNFKFAIKKTGSNSNHNDEKLIDICKSINKLDISDRQILYDKYFKVSKENNIALSVSYSMDENFFYIRLKQAVERFYKIYKRK